MKPLLATATFVFALSALTTGAGIQLRPPPAARAAAPDPAFLKQYCVSCHSDRLKAGTLSLEALDVASVDGHVEVWEKVVRKLRTGMMPPDGVPKPEPAARTAFAAALEASLDRAATARPDPGMPALHRLNRVEYANAIRDVLALDVDVAALLPPDDSAAGFDNIADVLGVSPALIEGYAAAAAQISRRAIGSPRKYANGPWSTPRNSARVSCGLVVFFPDGSPIIAVKSPITNTTRWPPSWKCRILRRSTV